MLFLLIFRKFIGWNKIKVKRFCLSKNEVCVACYVDFHVNALSFAMAIDLFNWDEFSAE